MASALLPAYSLGHRHGTWAVNRFASQGVSEGRGCQTLNARCIRYRRHDVSQKAGVVILILEADTGHQAYTRLGRDFTGKKLNFAGGGKSWFRFELHQLIRLTIRLFT